LRQAWIWRRFIYRTEAEHYWSNLESGEPSVWVALRPTGADPPYALFAVTVDPAEGESLQAGGDVVDAVPMPAAMREIVEAFVAKYHVVQPHYRRTRTGACEERREPLRKGPKG
jgi:Protein of unknown function (DUF3305)